MDTFCPFCDILAKNTERILFETRHFFSILPHWPIHSGHRLIIPKRHVPDIFALNDLEMRNLRFAFKATKQLLDEQFKPDGYNIGVNMGEAAGQSVFHLHLHLIPRFHDDVPDPRGGIIRNLLQNYQNAERPSWLPEFPKQNDPH